MKTPRRAKRSDFEKLREPKGQTCSLVFGDPGTGKTTFALRWAPSPNAFFNFDGRASWAIRKAEEAGKDIHLCNIDSTRLVNASEEETKVIAQSAIDKFNRNFELAVEESRKGRIRSITIDTATELDTLLLLVARGGVLKLPKRDYGASKGIVNKAINDIFSLARSGNAHLIVLARANQLWRGHEPIDEWVPKCSSAFSDGADWRGHIRVKASKRRRLDPTFSIEITKAGSEISELSRIYTSEDWGELGPFSYASMMQFPGLDLAVWEDGPRIDL